MDVGTTITSVNLVANNVFIVEDPAVSVQNDIISNGANVSDQGGIKEVF